MEIFHNLNTKNSPVYLNSEAYYPLHILIEKDDQTYKIGSNLGSYLKHYITEVDAFVNHNASARRHHLYNLFREKDLNRFVSGKIFPFYNIMQIETGVVKKILSNNEESLNNQKAIEKTFKRNTTEITVLLNREIKRQYRLELDKVFKETLQKSTEKEIFNISNFLIHYINWNNSFFNYYETISDLMFDKIKKLENKFSKNFLLNLKAYLAFISKINTLERYNEKREMGKVCSITFLDWEEQIQHFLEKDFIELFGKQKGVELIHCIDSMIEQGLTLSPLNKALK